MLLLASLTLAACHDATAPTPQLEPTNATANHHTGFSLAPTSGLEDGGTTVMISGSFPLSFQMQVGVQCFPFIGCRPVFATIHYQYSVRYGGTNAIVNNVTPSAIVTTTPIHLPGPVAVEVIACASFPPPQSCHVVSAPNAFTYLPRNRPPVANAGGPYTVTEGSALTLDGSASTDPDGDPLIYTWSFGDGSVGAGAPAVIPHVYQDNGTYNATLTVRDPLGSVSLATAEVVVSNVAPSVSGIASAEIMAGETYTSGGTFSDPGLDTHVASVDWGDGSSQALAHADGAFNLSHAYAAAGAFTVAVTVTDDDGGTGTSTATVTVLSPAGAAEALGDQVEALVASGAISPQVAGSLASSVEAALISLQSGNTTAARGQLNAVLNKMKAAVKTGRLDPTVAAQLESYVNRILSSAALTHQGDQSSG